MKSLKKSWLLVGTFLAGIVGGGLVASQVIEHKLAAFQQRLTAQPIRYTPTKRSVSVGQQPTGAFEAAAQKALPGVVYISARSEGRKSYFGLEEYFSSPSRATGSGVIISEDGFIVTNYHVVEGASTLSITLYDNAEYTGELVAVDPNTDLAVVRITDAGTDTFEPIPFADSDDVKIGAWVLAIGNPFNLTSTVTAGIVSARARSIGILRGRRTRRGADYAIESFLQTDAAVNPGNSGGALVNLEGALVGINTAIATQGEAFQGYSFAIPANLVQKVARDLMRYGVVQRGFIGVSIRDASPAAVKRFDLQTRRGAVVFGLTEGGAAASAGLKIGDVITAVEGRAITSASALQEQVANYSPGQPVTVSYLRGARRLQTRIVLRNADGKTQLLAAAPAAPAEADLPAERDLRRAMREALGASFIEARPRILEDLALRHGVLVFHVAPEMPVANAGIAEGTVLTHIGGEPLFSDNQLFHAILNATGPLQLQGTSPTGAVEHYTLSVE